MAEGSAGKGSVGSGGTAGQRLGPEIPTPVPAGLSFGLSSAHVWLSEVVALSRTACRDAAGTRPSTRDAAGGVMAAVRCNAVGGTGDATAEATAEPGMGSIRSAIESSTYGATRAEKGCRHSPGSRLMVGTTFVGESVGSLLWPLFESVERLPRSELFVVEELRSESSSTGIE